MSLCESPALDKIWVSYVRQGQFDSPAEDGDLPQDGLVLDPALAQPNALNLIIFPPGSGHPLNQPLMLFPNPISP